MAKPTEDLDWATDGGATDILEPTAGQRTSGVVDGGSWTRRRLNWMFNGLGKWVDWAKNDAMDKTANLSDLSNNTTSRANLGVLEAGTVDGQARTNLQNDGRFVQGNEGTLDAEFRTNLENDGRFVQTQPDPNAGLAVVGGIVQALVTFASNAQAGVTVEFYGKEVTSGGSLSGVTISINSMSLDGNPAGAITGTYRILSQIVYESQSVLAWHPVLLQRIT